MAAIKFNLVALLLIQARHFVEGNCNSFSLGECTDIGSAIFENDKVPSALRCQDLCHDFKNCAYFNFFDGVCKLYSVGDTRSKCKIIGGSPTQSVEDCILGNVADGGCDAFIQEECDFEGQDTGFSAPPGEITNPSECELHCKTWQDIGCDYWVFNATSEECITLDSATRVCWGLSGPDDPMMDTCRSCSEEIQQFVAVETVNLQPVEYKAGQNGLGACNVKWNLTGGVDGTEVWRLDNSCGGVALSQNNYRDFEFNGTFQRQDKDDDSIGFVFGYEDPGHFYLIIATGDWGTHVNETKPWRLVKVESETAATTNDMMKAIQSGEDTPGQTEVLYRSDIQGWHKDSIYSMSINYQPSINTLEIMVKKDSQDLWSKLWDKTFLQSKTIGKVGMFAHSQFVRFYDSTIKEECVI